MLDTNFWKKYFKVYDILNKLVPYQELLDVIYNELKIKRGDKILDVGSGTGNLAIKLKKNGGDVIGLDFSKEGIEIHKKKDCNAKIVLGDIKEPFPFSDNYFNKICSNNTIYTIPKDARLGVFKEFFRVLKPGGVVVVSNIIKGFKPFEIYKAHIYREIKNCGIFHATYRTIKFIKPTVKIFYYNYLIKKENKYGNYDFLDENEQKKLLKSSGFVRISENKFVYSEQAILNSAHK
jgi:ubiquinone/menaquinone biosynthesis C-methylase UbiE